MFVECKFRWLLPGALLFLAIFFLSAPLTIYFLQKHFTIPSLVLTTLGVSSLSLMMTFFLILFCLLQKKETLRMIWKNSQTSYFSDIGYGILGWIISFPVATLLMYLAEKMNYLFFGTKATEQAAIHYLRMVAKSPGLLTIALISNIILAPLIEEFVFRGFLQTYLKQKLKFKWALIISSFVFAILHFSFSHGLENFPLLLSLFSLSLVLGFLYEKQQSLVSPITLHMTFNLITVIRILLLKD